MEYDISDEAQLSLDHIWSHVSDDNLYTGPNTELVALTNGLREAGYNPSIVKKTWLYCGGLCYSDRPEYSDYWNMFWTKKLGYIRGYPNPEEYGLLSYELDMVLDNIPSCTCGHRIKYVNFICDPTFTKLLLIGSDCTLKFCGGAPCQKCGKLQSVVRPLCSKCRCTYKLSNHPEICFQMRNNRCCNERNSILNSKYCNYHYNRKDGLFDKLKIDLKKATCKKRYDLDNKHTYGMRDINCFSCKMIYHRVGVIIANISYFDECSVCFLYKKCMTELFNEYEERRDDLDKYHSKVATVPRLCRECYKVINPKYRYCFHCNEKRL